MNSFVTALIAIPVFVFGIGEFCLRLETQLGISFEYTGLLSFCVLPLIIVPIMFIGPCYIQEKNVPYFEIRSVVGLTGLITCTFAQKHIHWKATLDWNYYPEYPLLFISLIALQFYSIFALEASFIGHLDSEVHRKTELFAGLIIVIATYHEIGFDFSHRRPLRGLLNLSLGALLLKLGLILKVKVIGPSCPVDKSDNRLKLE